MVFGGDSTAEIRYLEEMRKYDVIQRIKRIMLEILDLQERQSVLDAGCGTGEDAIAIAELVGPGGNVLGVDKDWDKITKAIDKLSGQVVGSAPTNFIPLDLTTMSVLADSVFDRIFCDRVLQHLDNPAAGLREMFRVLKPGGRVVVHDPIWQSAVLGVPGALDRVNSVICQALYSAYVMVPSPRVASYTHSLLREAGFSDIELFGTPVGIFIDYEVASQVFQFDTVLEKAYQVGQISKDEADEWKEKAKEVSRAGDFFSCLSSCIATAVKP